MQRIKDLLKSAFALRATVICITAMVVSIAVVALALNLTVYGIKIDDNGNTATYKVYSKTVKGAFAEAGIELKEGDELSAKLTDSVRDYDEITITRAKTVIVALNDKEQIVHTTSQTVNEMVEKLGIPLGDTNLLLTNGETPISENLKVEIIAKTYREVKESEAIPYETKSVANNTMKKGTENVKTAGVNGEKVKTYKVLEHNGEVLEKQLVSEEVTKKPVTKIVEYGTVVATVTNRGDTSSRKTDAVKTSSSASSKSQPAASSSSGTTTKAGGNLSYSKVLEMTAYSYTGGGLTASGSPCAVGRVAVDPSVIPLGTRLYIEAWDGSSWTYGYAVAADTGGAIKGYKIDLYRNSESECRNFGVRKAKVYILN